MYVVRLIILHHTQFTVFIVPFVYVDITYLK
jgi:hypothetical protein